MPALVRLKDLVNDVALTKSGIYAAIKQGNFPRPVKIGIRAVAWRSDDVERWKASRPVTTSAS
jgi:prophage regulatory protein